MASELFSVIIPVYNCASFLQRSVESVLKQSYPLVEIVLVDDGSDDGSGEICDTYVKRYDNCKVVHQENKGLAAARNSGLDKATGNYICFLDADDYLEKNMLTRVAAELEKGMDICSFGARRVDEAENYLYEMRFDAGIGRYDFSQDDRQVFLLNCFLQYQVGWEACLQVYRRSFLEEHGIRFDETIRYGEDKLFSGHCFAYVCKYVKIPDILYNYTLRNGSLTERYQQEELINLGNFEFLQLQDPMKKCGIMNAENDYLFYIGLLYYYYTILQKKMSLEELKVCVEKAEQQQLQQDYFSKVLQHKRELGKVFDKGTSAEIVRVVSTLLRE